MTSDLRFSELIGRSPLVHARATALVGVPMLASGSFANVVISRLIVRDDIVATSGNFVASEFMLRLGIVSNLIMMVAWLFYALLLYRLLRPVDKSHAMTMVVLVLASVPIYMLNQVNLFAALLSASDQLHEQVKLYLEFQRFGSLVASIFFGLWLFPLGLLVFKSGFLPRAIGILLMIGSLGYLVLFVQGFLFPGSERTLWTNPFLVVTHLSELALWLWLLIKGVDVEKWEKCAHQFTAQ
ncbi:MAG: DUF4386 domain-containing protein [Proteobacteria bacterium]|nr:DUF4386 domain-containing protein [Pseudomonadota bacterium]